MSLQKGIIAFFIIASILGISIIFIQRASWAACPHDDRKVCRFLRWYKRSVDQPMSGVYRKSADERTIELEWSRGDLAERIETTELTIPLRIITTEKDVYLYRSSDEMWLHQRARDFESFDVTLPFAPTAFFDTYLPVFTSESTRFMFVQETSCGEETCLRYKVIYPEQSADEQLFVYISSSDYSLKSMHIIGENIEEKVSIASMSADIQLPEDLREISPGRNMYLEYLDQKEKEEQKNFEYLQQFETERQEAEQNGTTNIKYVEDTPTPTP